MGVEHCVGARVLPNTLAQAGSRTTASSARVEAVSRSWVSADLGDSRGSSGGCAGSWAVGRRSTGACRRLVDRVGWVAALGGRLGGVVGLAGIQQAAACASMGITGGENGEAAGLMGVAVRPAVLFAARSDGELGTSTGVVADLGDELCRACCSWLIGGDGTDKGGGDPEGIRLHDNERLGAGIGGKERKRNDRQDETTGGKAVL